MKNHPAFSKTYWVNIYPDNSMSGVLCDSENDALNRCVYVGEKPIAQQVLVKLVPVAVASGPPRNDVTELKAAWAKHIGCTLEDERVKFAETCGWPVSFADFQAGWNAAQPIQPVAEPDRRIHPMYAWDGCKKSAPCEKCGEVQMVMEYRGGGWVVWCMKCMIWTKVEQ